MYKEKKCFHDADNVCAISPEDVGEKMMIENGEKSATALIGKNLCAYRLYFLFKFRVCEQVMPNFFTGVYCGGVVSSSEPLADGGI